MDIETKEQTIRRILVALDASVPSMDALGAAADLAAIIKAELIGMFVEDVNFVHLAELPFTRTVRYPSDQDQALNRAGMESHFQRLASQIRRALIEAAEEAEVNWSFQVVRGQVTPALLEAALQADMLALGRVSHSPSRRNKLGSTARAIVKETQQLIYLPARTPSEPYSPIFFTYNGSPAAQKGLLLVSSLADNAPLACLLIGDLEILETLKAQVLAHLSPRQAKRTTFHYIPTLDPQHLSRMVNLERGNLLVVTEEMPALSPDEINNFLDSLNCAVILVRSPSP